MDLRLNLYEKIHTDTWIIQCIRCCIWKCAISTSVHDLENAVLIPFKQKPSGSRFYNPSTPTFITNIITIFSAVCPVVPSIYWSSSGLSLLSPRSPFQYTQLLKSPPHFSIFSTVILDLSPLKICPPSGARAPCACMVIYVTVLRCRVGENGGCRNDCPLSKDFEQNCASNFIPVQCRWSHH